MDRIIQLKEEIAKIEKENDKAFKEGLKILALLPEISYSWFCHDIDRIPEGKWQERLDKDWKNILKYTKDGKYNIVKYIVSNNGNIFIEIRNENSLIYIPSEMYIRLAGACWSETVWFRCFKGQQEFIRNNLYINSRCYFENTKDDIICLDMTRMNVLYSGYLEQKIYCEDFTKEDSDFTLYKSGIDLEKIQKKYFDIVSWIDNEKDKKNWVKLYNNDRGKLLLTVLHMLDIVYNSKYDFSSKYHKEPKTEDNFFDLQNHDKYGYHNFDLSLITKNPENDPLFKKPFHNARECYDVFKEIQNKYKTLDIMVHNLPKWMKENLERVKTS